MAEYPGYTEIFERIDNDWVATERATIGSALPVAMTADRHLADANEMYRNALTRVATLREQREPDAEPLGDMVKPDSITTLVQQAKAEVEALTHRIEVLSTEYNDLGTQQRENTSKHATLTERANQARQLAEEMEAEAQVATSASEHARTSLAGNWDALLETQHIYHTEKQAIDALRATARRVTELDQARGRLDSIEDELSQITAGEELIPYAHRVPIETAREDEAIAGQHAAAMSRNRNAAVDTINAFHQKRRENEEYRQQMNAADEECRTFNELAELLKPGGSIQKAVAEQEQRKIAVDANAILEQLNDTLRIHIAPARRGKEQQDVTIVDTSDAGSNINGSNQSHRYFEFLSGGEQFRVALALVLALHRRIIGGDVGTLIVDEGFGALDGQRRDRLASQLADTSQGILGLGLAHSLIICSHATEVQRHFRDNCWIVEKRGGTASVRRANEIEM